MNHINKRKIGDRVRSPGGQEIFTMEEEAIMVAHIVATSTYGFPVTVMDLKVIAQSYLNSIGRKVKIFKNNIPGRAWVEGFLKRHHDISRRVARNISLNRASVNEGTVERFFQNLKEEIEGVPPENLWNYDETNLQDDPGCTKVLVKRGTKYPERIRNATKACTTVMMCGNANGDCLPPYVIFKAENVYSTWKEGGPRGTRYNRTKSGWIDHIVFQDWFVYHLLPVLRRQSGRKVIIGDGLSSHFTVDVLKLCQEHNVTFVALPPHTSHLLQPLDVAYFRSMKGEWRKLLNEWKDTPYGRRCGTIPKEQFPKLLSKLWDNLLEKGKENLKSGFKKSGIFPFDKEPVFRRLSNTIIEHQPQYREKIGDSFLNHLQTLRGTTTECRKRKKKLNLTPGKGITPDDLNNESQPSTSKPPKTKKKEKTKNIREKTQDSSESDASISYQNTDDSIGSLDLGSDNDFCDITGQQSPETPSEATKENSQHTFNVGDYVVADYEGRKYPGKIISKESGDYEYEVSSMVKCGKYWKWPEKEDIIWFPSNKIIKKIDPPKSSSSSRNIFLIDLKK